MKEVIERLREEQRVYLDKAQTIGKAVALLMNDDVSSFIPKNGESDATHVPFPAAVRSSPSLKKGTLRDLVLDVIREDGPIECNDISEMLMAKFPLLYESRSYQSVRGAVSGTMTYLRRRKPKVRNLQWDRKGKSFSYWFEGKR